ncbi:MAG: lipid-A-disaccharide synthase [Bacteroidota bacterium]
MKYYLIAGERSGDLHASNLIRAIYRNDAQADIRAWGGEMTQEAGATLVKHYRDLAFMGFWEVIKNLRTILGFLRFCKQDILFYQPDVVILVDYAGFNMRVAKFAKAHGFQVFYYISPKVWAWNQSRAYKIKALVDRMFVIFPFEKAFFAKYDYPVDYVGNPLFDAIAAYQPEPNFRKIHQLSSKPIIALLPGSRKQEVEHMLQTMTSVIPHFPDYQFVIGGVSNLPHEVYESFQATFPTAIVFDAAYDLLSNAYAALVTSGTATLETALFNVPQVVCYRTGAISYAIGKRVVKVAYISLVNLIAEKEVVRELIQHELTTENLTAELKKITWQVDQRQQQLEEYARIRAILGEPGASEKAGKLMVAYAKKR